MIGISENSHSLLKIFAMSMPFPLSMGRFSNCQKESRKILIQMSKSPFCIVLITLELLFTQHPKRLDAITDALIHQSQFGGIYCN